MSRIVFLVEEYSMKLLLEGLLPRFYPDLQFLCVSHEGKQDLEKSVPRKLRAWREPGVRFVIVRDNDGGDCLAIKGRLLGICGNAGRPDSVVRLACQELEAWYLGDPAALSKAFSEEKLNRIGATARFRDPDSIQRPSEELRKLVPTFQKTIGARRMASCLVRERNTSRSFHALLQSVDRFVDMPSDIGK